ncbi:MAG: hypothetical protein AAB333_02000, partial [Pseudomonadota bacterium]
VAARMRHRKKYFRRFQVTGHELRASDKMTFHRKDAKSAKESIRFPESGSKLCRVGTAHRLTSGEAVLVGDAHPTFWINQAFLNSV